MQADLLVAYTATTYRVFPGSTAPPIDLRIGAAHAALDDLLRDHGVETAALITAYNPLSVPLTESENTVRQHAFERDLSATGHRYLAALGVPDAPDWGAELSVLVLGMNRKVAIRTAQKYEQNALVWLELNSAPELVWAATQHA